jgi:acyl transferase domain-containing protein
MRENYAGFQKKISLLWQKVFNKNNLSPEERFNDLGGHSEQADQLYHLVYNVIGDEKKALISPTIAYDYPSVAEMASYLWDLKNSIQPATYTKSLYQDDAIAIIGMSFHYPGNATNAHSFWEILFSGKDTISEVPSTRFDINRFYDPSRKKEGKTVSRWGGFLEGIDLFDAPFFGISPKEAVFLDPQQRLLLELTWHALESAGINPRSLIGSLTGVFTGAMFHDYQDLLLKNKPEGHQNAYYGIGNAFSAISGRIAYTLGLQGPCMTIDTACSSSLVAIHEACQSLKVGECKLGIASGVNLILTPETTIAYSQAGMLSRDGYCKTFSADANGYVRSEGAGVLILKRLHDALQDQDPILVVLKGSFVNQDGRSSGITAPNAVAQEHLLRQALSNANVTPEQIDYFEAHGTGTKLGDPIEMAAINAVYSGSHTSHNPLVIGCLKTNIGHCEAASGIASLIKIILSLQHNLIPKHLHFKSLNPRINLNIIPAQIPIEGLSWERRDHQPRRAGVSSFGFSGTNAHMIVEEAPPPQARGSIVLPSEQLLVLSAKSKKSLGDLMSDYKAYLATTEDNLSDICYTAAQWHSVNQQI